MNNNESMQESVVMLRPQLQNPLFWNENLPLGGSKFRWGISWLNICFLTAQEKLSSLDLTRLAFTAPKSVDLIILLNNTYQLKHYRC